MTQTKALMKKAVMKTTTRKARSIPTGRTTSRCTADMEQCAKCGAMNKYSDKKDGVYFYVCRNCGNKWSKIFVKTEAKPTPVPAAKPEPTRENKPDFDAWIADNFQKASQIAKNLKQDSPVILAEIMRERHSEYMNNKIELQKLQHMQLIRTEKEVKK